MEGQAKKHLLGGDGMPLQPAYPSKIIEKNNIY